MVNIEPVAMTMHDTTANLRVQPMVRPPAGDLRMAVPSLVLFTLRRRNCQWTR